MSSPETMKAIVCEAPGSPSTLVEHQVTVPSPAIGQALIKILGFGLNRGGKQSTLYNVYLLCQGHMALPQILGIECYGTIAGYNEAETAQRPPVGSRVFTCMGGLGREIPGSYAEYTCASIGNLREVPTTTLTVAQLSALPEMLQATWGALTTGLDVQPGDRVLIRGATSSIGLCAIQLARKLGATYVAATTRNAGRKELLSQVGADKVIIDDGKISQSLQLDEKFDRVMELIGTPTINDSIVCARDKGTVCVVGNQSGGSWILENFSPFFIGLPNRVRLCAYGGGPQDLHTVPLEELIKDVEQGKLRLSIKVFGLDRIQEAHGFMEAGGGGSKMVVVL
ncbi:unnamed protein product [Clonostachys solani]|uniref:Enoyl reductase (ER) domain-containing protein n=1 Tax=Clonostachys solani TaxID=160281 RepID=A0A9N9ZNS4_9HYPO|nr:unnamed protein product [Clonostachys solani]